LMKLRVGLAANVSPQSCHESFANIPIFHAAEKV